jgi:hypothetical protein
MSRSRGFAFFTVRRMWGAVKVLFVSVGGGPCGGVGGLAVCLRRWAFLDLFACAALVCLCFFLSLAFLDLAFWSLLDLAFWPFLAF